MTWVLAGLSIRTGIPMSVLAQEPDDYVQAMLDVLEWQADREDR